MNKEYFPPETAGRLMTGKVPQVSSDTSIGEVEQLLLDHIRDFDSINYVYVVDESKKLKGVISIKELFRRAKETKVSAAMKKDPVTVRPHTDQERLAYLALKHNIKAIPVIDKDETLLGVVTSDVILLIMYKETQEDILRFAGIRGAEIPIDKVLDLSVTKLFGHRIPWLLIGLLGGFVVAGVIRFFEKTLAQNLILAAFIPLIVYMADSTRVQMEAFVIRDSAIEPKLNFRKYFFKQLSVVVLVALLISSALFLFSLISYKNLALGVTLGIALFAAILSSTFTGLIIPLFFSKLKLDPANASGPIATIIQDILSVTIYFAIASLLL